MGSKYIRHGATYNGDGTSSALATVDGGIGAWNTITYFENTTPAYGVLADGDVVYIRSKDEADADIVRTLSAAISIGIAGLTAASQGVTWILDDGTVWAGVDGTLTYLCASTVYVSTLQHYNHLISLKQSSLIYKSNGSVGANVVFLNCGFGSHLKNIKTDFSVSNNINHYARAYQLAHGCIVENPEVIVGNCGTSPLAQRTVFGAVGFNGTATIINPKVEYLVNSEALLYCDTNYRFKVFISGGEIYGAGATTGLTLITGNQSNSQVYVTGMKVPRSVTLSYTPPAQTMYPGVIEFVGSDTELGGFATYGWGWMTSRTDNNPPTLSAAYPASTNVPWAWRVYPIHANALMPMQIQSTKMYTQADAIKTITQEILITDSMILNKRSLWITVTYTDTNGIQQSLSTRDFSASSCDASTANWSATVWGMTTLEKVKLSATTPLAIKQNTLITVSLFGTYTATSDSEIYFVDPDFGVN